MKYFIIIVILILTVGSFLFDSFMRRKRSNYQNKLMNLLINQKYSQFEKLIDQKKAKENIPPYNRFFLHFTSCIMRDDLNGANKILSKINKMKLSDRQSLSFYGRALGFYINQKDRKESRVCYEKIKQIKKDSSTKSSLIELYKVMVLNDFSDKEKIIQRLKNDNPQAKITDYHMLFHISKVENNKSAAIKYHNLEKQAMSNL